MKKSLLACLALLIGSAAAPAAPYDEMDYGPFITATYTSPMPKGNIIYRGVAQRFQPMPGDKTPEGKVGMIFDTEMLRPAAWWTGGFVEFKGVVFNGAHGANPSPKGKQVLGTKASPGWAKDGDLKDPRSYKWGPLPRDWARYRGLYRNGDVVVYSYTVGKLSVLEMPFAGAREGVRYFGRSIQFEPVKGEKGENLVMVVADVDGAKGKVENGVALLEKDGNITLAKAIAAPAGAVFDIVDGSRIVMKIPAPSDRRPFSVVLWTGPKAEQPAAVAAIAEVKPSQDLTTWTKGGAPIWNETAVTEGKRAPDKGAYVMDQLTVPFKNPYKSWMRIGGFDFFSDGRAAVCTWSGDVWIVSGIDDSLKKLTWKRFAAGLFQPLGLKIVNDQIYVLCRDQICRLHDLNGDGEADFYECFNNDAMVTTGFHEFTFDLHTDPEGNFYFNKGGSVRPGGSGWEFITPHNGCIFKVSKDGTKFEVVARGFRAPNGMCVGPHGEITCGDNEGTWTPMCPLNWIKPGGFYGVPEFAGLNPKTAIRDNPLCWMPKNVDNSNGGQVWITGDKFGPLSGQLMHTSYGTCSLFLVLKEEVAGEMQGGVVSLKLPFDSGVCRARFIEKQNALYLTALRGWQTTAQKDAGFYRVRYTGQNAYLPIGLKVEPGKIKLTFTDALDKSIAQDATNFNLEEWNYRWTQNYGSPHIKVSDPKKTGHDEVEVSSATLSPDGKTVTLAIEKLHPVMQMKIGYNLKAADGAPVKGVIHNTINVVGDLRAELHPGELKIVNIKK